jgi:argininosuccinate lyase
MTLWSGGRFEASPAEEAWAFTVDHADRRMLDVDIEGSLAHVAMLARCGIVTDDEAETLTEGLVRIADEASDGSFPWSDDDEDVHSAVERRLTELVGDVAGKLHTGRSRNDQVALDIRLSLRRAAQSRISDLKALIEVLIDQARACGPAVVASYTHLQQAQPVPFAHHLLAHAWVLVRDAERFAGVRTRLDVSPLGAGASGGSSLPLEPGITAALLGMDGVFDNSMDAVGSRDLVAEYTWCAAQSMTNLSRLAEDVLLWSTAEFGWVTLADEYTTGSSAMPQKKNADIAELVRGKAAAVIGDVTAVLALQKGLPMTYNRDLQEDKRIVFHADDALAGSLAALRGLLGTARFHPRPPQRWVTALDLAEALVGRGVPFREAHHVVGRLVSELVAAGETFDDVTGERLVEFDARFEPADVDRLEPEHSMRARISPGGGSATSVEVQIERLETLLDRWG